ncbi:SMP-30/Gluconolaconase/LRE-like region-containing protein [Pseudoxanthomonas suwonensis 11-1]|uniref:SMP-30/Gluconolaconase/LRE-like region-containing protein n=1 Tax=Pseudoxanthomonas suwonensis (strain 11-1) TaxID=743721 RepID=E6WX70_PSEUU|nr:SMP-30/gluconolactonase/LRE family protein [Pseudoxanthomonas suwonensis]ADV28769.1 SMP-30/Gluconolaconase/LRE-like region-containing protein [Pseudoxanthomonas suwonensis 11-1]
MSRPVRTALSAAVFALVLGACQRGDDTPAADTTPAPEQPAASTVDADAPSAASSNPYCSGEAGTAPSGELVAQRIRGADGDGANGLYEGPVWNGQALYFSDFRFSDGFPSRIRRLGADGTVETAIEDSGSNGLALGSDGALVAATHDRKELSRYDLADGSRIRIVGEFEGQPFNSPNDLVIGTDGTIWFTDPDFQRSAAPGGQPKTRVYRVGTDGQVSVVDDSIANPNGIALSPDGRTLYVAGGGDQGVLRAYPLDEAGQAGAGRDLASTAVPDGMAIDCLGNIYLTEHNNRRVRVLSPEGDALATITVDANITNAAFGGPQRRTLYLTGAGAVWSIDLEVAGLPY